jgi:PKD repeat protein
MPGVAWASDLGTPPDGDGHYMHCNVNASPTSGTVTFYISCQYGPTTSVVTAHTFYFWNTASSEFNISMYSGATIVRNSGGKYRASKSVGITGTLDRSHSNSGCNVSGSPAIGTGSRAQCQEVVPFGSTAGYPAYPTDHWSGGTPGTAAPTACVTVSPVNPQTGETITFDGSCSVDADAYGWTIAGRAHTGVSVARSFAQPGTYNWTMVATNENGTDTETGSVVVGDADDDGDECGAWWHLVCHLTYLFVPQESLTDRWEGLEDAATDTWPLGPATWSTGELVDGLTDFRTGVVDGPLDDDLDPDYIGLTGEFCSDGGDFGVNLDLDGDGDTPPSRVDVLPGTCGNDLEGDLDNFWFNLVRDGFRVLMGAFVVWTGARFIYRQAMGLMGSGEAG